MACFLRVYPRARERPGTTERAVLPIALAAMFLTFGCTTPSIAPTPNGAREVPRETDFLDGWGVNWNDAMESAAYFSRHATSDPQEIDSLIAALEVEGVREFVLRENAARALALAGDPRAVPALIRRLDEDPDEYVRKAAAHALGALRAREAVPTLLARVLDVTESHGVTTEAVEALGVIGDASVIGALERFRAGAADFWMESTALEAALERLRAVRAQGGRP